MDVLPSQASSIPCEQILSNAKLELLNATDRRTYLKEEVFETLQIMKSKWRDRLRVVNLVEANEEDSERYDIEFMNFLIAEEEWDTWEQEGAVYGVL